MRLGDVAKVELGGETYAVSAHFNGKPAAGLALKLATGAGNREIATALFVTEATVKSHLAHIFTKLDVDSRSRAIHVAQQVGLL